MPPLSRVYPFSGIKLRVRRGNRPRRDPQNRVEGIHRIEAAVKPEHEFIEVGLQMTRFYPAVMSAIDPRLQIREDKMDHRQMLFRLLWVTPKDKRIVFIAHSGKVVISLPAIRANNGARCYVVLNECCKRFRVAPRQRNLCLFDARDNTEPEAPSVSELFGRNAARTPPPRILARPNFNGANDGRLMMNSPSFATRAPANAAFVYFDGVRLADGITVRTYHPGAEFMEHRKRRLIRGNIKLALELNGRLAGCLCRHEVSAPKPRRERHMARLHDRPCGKGRIFLTGAATQHDRRTRCETVRLASMPARWAREAVGPAHRLQIAGASAIVRENTLKLWKARGKGCVHV